MQRTYLHKKISVKMKKVILVAITITCSVVIFISCSKGGRSDDNNGGGGCTQIDCTNVPKSFATDVNPIIQTFCNQANCHNVGSGNGPGPLTKYIEVFDARARIRPQIIAGLMPQNTTLTTAQKNIIVCWIDAGAPNN
jgi:hypothetical protein